LSVFALALRGLREIFEFRSGLAVLLTHASFEQLVALRETKPSPIPIPQAGEGNLLVLLESTNFLAHSYGRG
jgi:hypothetical protein